MTERWQRWTKWVASGWVRGHRSAAVYVWLDTRPGDTPSVGAFRVRRVKDPDGYAAGWWAPLTEEEEAALRLGGADAAWAAAESRLNALEPGE